MLSLQWREREKNTAQKRRNGRKKDSFHPQKVENCNSIVVLYYFDLRLCECVCVGHILAES